MSMDWAPVVTTLVGVVLGGGMSLIPQRYSQRHADKVEKQRQVIARAEARRSERIVFFDHLMTATQEAERVAIDRHHGDLAGDEFQLRAATAMDEVWVEQKLLDAVSVAEVRDAVYEFAVALDQVIWNGPGDLKVWQFLNKTRGAVVDAARRDFATLDLQH